MRIANFENKKCYNINNENSLQLEVVKFLRKSGLLFSCTHTEEMLDSDGKRIDANRHGFTSGMPDLMIYTSNHSFTGMAIELKNPWGTGALSSEQEDILEKLSDNGWFCLVSNDLTEVCNLILMYQHNLIQNS